ncbi:fumarylacetoacetate hydrolase family protein [Sphingobium fuliginis ATCC 27551]|uniref:Fumarylacetoacetate hydrolase family protein n=2 Tax=Sphingobium fuliginis (strain ATCC 27551) TaxID=336203 RepID=A0A5B8CKD1_SPHSA|nr:fumarylacetoacetate hydrolase family protein [Sphingobium fuliginis ATCC 27551]
MKLCCFDEGRLGVVIGDEVADISEILAELPAPAWPGGGEDRLFAALPALMPKVESILDRAPRKPLSQATLRLAVAPTKVIGAPVNYRDHAAEAEADKETFFAHQLIRIQEIGLFLKANSSLVAPAQGIALRHSDRRTDHELELALVIGKTADRVSRDDALDYVAGYAIGLDMTVRGKEERSFRKSIDTYSVFGPWIVTADEIEDPGNLDMELTVNGEVRQSANTRDLVLGVPELIEMASSYYTLHPGDIIMTGTPAGVGPVAEGDTIHARIDGIGSITVKVRAA